jgi:hypothetical protein
VDGEYDYELHFIDDKQMEEYIKIKFNNNRTEKEAARQSSRKRKKKTRKKK